jgi:hypothetical protein
MEERIRKQIKSSCTVTFSEPFQHTLAAQSALYVEPDFRACHDLFETLAIAREGCRILRHIKANILRLGPIGPPPGTATWCW